MNLRRQDSVYRPLDIVGGLMLLQSIAKAVSKFFCSPECRSTLPLNIVAATSPDATSRVFCFGIPGLIVWKVGLRSEAIV
jgi:hypothetical protein